MEVFGAVIKLQDNVTGVLKQAAASSGTFRSEVQKARQELEKFDKKKLKEKEIRVKNSAAYKAIEGVKKKLEPISKKVVQLKAKEEHAVSKIRKVKNELSKIKENKVISFATKGAAGVANAAGKVALAGTAAVFTGASAAGAVAVNQAIDFQSQMANVSTLLDGDVNAKIVSMGETVKQVSKDTGISTSNLTGGLYEVVSAFGESADSVKQLEIAAKAAKAGNAETADSVRMLASITKGYGDTSAGAVQKASDLAFMTVKLGQTSFPELAASMGSVVPLASTLKVSQEELFGAMATLTGVTGSTSEVTTQLKATMQGFMSPSKEMAEALKKMGYSSGAAALESEGLGAILDKLKASVNGDEVAFASMFSSVEAKNAVLALAGTQAENFTTKTDAMRSASGAADTAFKRQTSSVKEMAAKLKNQGMVALMSVGEKALPLLSSALDTVAAHMPKMESAVNTAMSRLGPIVSTAMGVVSSGIQQAGPIFGSLGVAANAAFPTVSQIAGEMGGTVQAALSMIGSHTEGLRGIIETAGPAVSTVLQTAWSVVSPLLDLAIAGVDLLMTGFEKAFPTIQSVVKSTWEIVGPIIEKLGKGIEFVAGGVKKVASYVSGGGSSERNLVGSNALGTSYWRGGYTTIAEHGPELVNLPAGAKVYSSSKTQNILNRGRKVNVTIQNMTVREEADVRKIAEEIVKELDRVDR